MAEKKVKVKKSANYQKLGQKEGFLGAVKKIEAEETSEVLLRTFKQVVKIKRKAKKPRY